MDRAPAAPPKIAIASSGLGHVQRGIEAWALDLGTALQRAGQAVSLFGGGPLASVVAVPCFRRTSAAAMFLARLFRHIGGWRYGLGSAYDVEQTSFAINLLRRLRSKYDIVHVQDPLLARLLELAYRKRLSRARVIYANGTGDDPALMRRFAHLQLLTPGMADAWRTKSPPGQTVHAIPNFIDTTLFVPGCRLSARAEFGLPPGSTIFLCCAAIRRRHKRIDVLLQEFATVASRMPDALLVVAGGREPDTDSLVREGTRLLGNQVRFFADVPRERMPLMYRAADAFVLPSLYEMFGIVLLEAMASGLPVLCNDVPDFHYIVGPAGLYRDLETPGALASGFLELDRPGARAPLAAAARPHVEATFSQPAVVKQIIAMYNAVMERP